VSRIEAIVSDFGGVLTSPLLDSFLAFEQQSGISPAALGQALTSISDRAGSHPLVELETGRMAEKDFMNELAQELSEQLDREVELAAFGEQYFEHLEPNQDMIDYMRGLRERGYRMAICTNNVKEWEARWRSMLPVDEIFAVVVDSAFVGARKPEPRIYEITLERLGVEPAATLLVDDIEINCDAARELGIRAVQFKSNEQAIAEIEATLE
jgi:epoxide hydrolase-like predicted phosphatase